MKKQSGFSEIMSVLVVDDDVDICETMRDILEADGYKADFRTTGESALDLLKSTHFDVVLLDIKMPDMDGIETLREIKQLRNDLPVIISSGLNIDEKQRTAIKEGAFGVIQKPISFDILYESLSAIRKKGTLVLIAGAPNDTADRLFDELSCLGIIPHFADSAASAIKKLLAVNYDSFVIATKYVQSNWQKLLSEIIELRGSSLVYIEKDFFEKYRLTNNTDRARIFATDDPLDSKMLCKALGV